MRSEKCFVVQEKSCIGCGVCTQVCPRGNYELTSQGVKTEGDCDFCFACIQNCPQKAIVFAKDSGYPVLAHGERNPECPFPQRACVLVEHQGIEQTMKNDYNQIKNEYTQESFAVRIAYLWQHMRPERTRENHHGRRTAGDIKQWCTNAPFRIGNIPARFNEICKQSCLTALKAGYRHIDTGTRLPRRGRGHRSRKKGSAVKEIQNHSSNRTPSGLGSTTKPQSQYLERMQSDYIIQSVHPHHPVGDFRESRGI